MLSRRVYNFRSIIWYGRCKKLLDWLSSLPLLACPKRLCAWSCYGEEFSCGRTQGYSATDRARSTVASHSQCDSGVYLVRSSVRRARLRERTKCELPWSPE